MKTLLSRTVPLLIILLFGLVLSSDVWLKRPFGHGDDVLGAIGQVKSRVEAGDWAGAATHVQLADQALQAVTPRILLPVDLPHMYRLEEEVISLEAAISAQDLPGALEHIAIVQYLYDELGH